MLLVEQHAVLRARQTSRQLRRPRVIAQLAIRVHLVQHLHVIGGQDRQIRLIPQTRNAFQVLAGTVGLITLKAAYRPMPA